MEIDEQFDQIANTLLLLAAMSLFYTGHFAACGFVTGAFIGGLIDTLLH